MIKIVTFYQQGANGWTETWYHNASTIADFSTATPQFIGWLQASIAMRASDVSIIGSRISNEAPPKLAQPFYYNGTYGPPSQSASFAPDVIATDAQYILFDSLYNKRFVTFRGLSDLIKQFTPAGVPIVPAQLSALVNAYMIAAGTAGFRLKIANKPGQAGVVQYALALVGPSATNENWSTITLAPGSAFAPTVGEKIIFHGINRDYIPGFPLKSQVMSVGAAPPVTFDIPYRYRSQTNTYAPTKAFVSALSYSYNNFAPQTSANVYPWQFTRFSERKTGRPFGVTRGRSRAVVRAQ